MKIIISPAKSITPQTLESTLAPTSGVFLDEAERLSKKLKALSAKKISKLMSVNADIAELNHLRFQNWVKPEV